MTSLFTILKTQHFLREISFYKMKFTTVFEYECLSKIINLRSNGITKISFKDCSLKENLIGQMSSKFKPQNLSSLAYDLTLQMRVSEVTDFENLYYQVRQIVDAFPIQILLEPIFKQNRKLASKSKFRLLNDTYLWPDTIATEYQQIKRFYLVKESRAMKGHLKLFKDQNLQYLFDSVMSKTLDQGILDLSQIKDIFTHSYHQERFIELMLRSVADNPDQISSLRVRLMNDQAFYEKHGFLAIKTSHFQRLVTSLPDNKLISLHLNMGQLSLQDTKSIENVFQCLSETVESHQRTLKELHFTDVSFDLNSNSEKDFYNSLSLPNLKAIVLNNCKFLCYDSFERFFTNLADTDDCITRLEINRLNCAVSAKSFKDFLISQEGSLQELVLTGVHKNILSRKHHKHVLPAIANLKCLKKLVLSKNLLDNDRFKLLATPQSSEERFQELQSLDVSQNELDNSSVLTLYKMLKKRVFALDVLNISENDINEEGINLLMKAKTEDGGLMLTKGILANKMREKNLLINNQKILKFEILEVGDSLLSSVDPENAVPGFQTLGRTQNQIRILNIQSNNFSSKQVQLMCEQYFLSKSCKIVSLNLSGQRFDETNIEILSKYIGTSPHLHDLTLNDCKLKDTLGAFVLRSWFNPEQTSRGDLMLEGNFFGEHLFQMVADDDGAEEVKKDDEGIKERHSVLNCNKISLARNFLTDQAVGTDFLQLLAQRQIRISSLNLSKNLLGKLSLIRIREFIEKKDLHFQTLDLSENHISALKSASILEMRQQRGITKVTYTRDPPKQKKEKRAKKNKQ